jgi:hypothetical protein
MTILTVVFGILLTALGIGNFVVSGMSQILTLLPALLGLLIVILGVVAWQGRSREQQNNAQFGAILLAILGFVGSLRELWQLFIALTSGQAAPTEVILRSVIGLSCVLFIILGILLIKDFWHGWKLFGHLLGNLLARVVLTIFYFTVFVPFALGVKLFSDPLHIKSSPAELWRPRQTGDQTLKDIMRQY